MQSFELDFHYLDFCDNDDLFSNFDNKSHSNPTFEIKSAKTSEFSQNFPSDMNTNPYKYDMKINHSNVPVSDISLKLMYQDGSDLPIVESMVGKNNLPSNFQTKLPLECHEKSSLSPTEHVIRFSLNVCSFHHKRRKFRISVSDGRREIFKSPPFRTLARKQKKSSKDIARAVVRKLESQTTPVTAQSQMKTTEQAILVFSLFTSLSPIEKEIVAKHINLVMHNSK